MKNMNNSSITVMKLKFSTSYSCHVTNLQFSHPKYLNKTTFQISSTWQKNLHMKMGVVPMHTCSKFHKNLNFSCHCCWHQLYFVITSK